jgi:hypothetical protein
MPEDLEQGAHGADDTGAKGTEQSAVEPNKSINSQAKELPWVKELMQSKAELDKLKSAQAEKEQAAEREKAEAEGNYQKALEMEQRKYEDLHGKYQSETRRMALEMEFTRAGLVDSRAVKLFETDYNPDEESAAEFVAKIKSDEKNALYFSTQRAPKDPPPASGIGQGSTVDPSWINSDDPKKREAAIAANRKAFWAKVHGG